MSFNIFSGIIFRIVISKYTLRKFFFQTYYTEINFYHPDQVDTLDDVDTDDDVDTELDVDTQKYNNTILFYFC